MPKVLLTANGARQFCIVNHEDAVRVEAILLTAERAITVRVATPGAGDVKFVLNTAHIIGVDYSD